MYIYIYVLCLKCLFPSHNPPVVQRLPGLEGVHAPGSLREERPKHALAGAWTFDAEIPGESPFDGFRNFNENTLFKKKKHIYILFYIYIYALICISDVLYFVWNDIVWKLIMWKLMCFVKDQYEHIIYLEMIRCSREIITKMFHLWE